MKAIATTLGILLLSACATNSGSDENLPPGLENMVHVSRGDLGKADCAGDICQLPKSLNFSFTPRHVKGLLKGMDLAKTNKKHQLSAEKGTSLLICMPQICAFNLNQNLAEARGPLLQSLINGILNTSGR